MTTDERLRTALLSVLPDVYPNIYTGAKLRYVVYQYSSYPRLLAESRAKAAVADLMVHLYLPHGDDPTALKGRMIEALLSAGCTSPTIEPAHDEEGQHYVFECELLERGLYG